MRIASIGNGEESGSSLLCWVPWQADRWTVEPNQVAHLFDARQAHMYPRNWPRRGMISHGSPHNWSGNARKISPFTTSGQSSKPQTNHQKRIQEASSQHQSLQKAQMRYINTILPEGLEEKFSRPFWRYIKSQSTEVLGITPSPPPTPTHPHHTWKFSRVPANPHLRQAAHVHRNIEVIIPHPWASEHRRLFKAPRWIHSVPGRPSWRCGCYVRLWNLHHVTNMSCL